MATLSSLVGKKVKYAKAGSFAKKRTVSKNVKRYVKRALHNQIENKWIDTAGTIAVAGTGTDYTNGSFIAITSIGQGSGLSQRTGDRIRLMRIELRLTCYPYVAAGAISSTLLRYMIVEDKEARGTAVPTTLTSFGITNSGSANAVNGMWSESVGKRYRIITQGLLEMDGGFGLDRYTVRNIYGKKLPKYMKFLSSAGSPNGVENVCYLVLFSDQATASAPSVNYVVRVFFEDA